MRATAERHGATYPDPGRNLGFGAAVNLALARRSPGRDVLLLNPDARVEPEVIGRLSAALSRAPRAACVAPLQRAPGAVELDRVEWPFPGPLRAWLGAVGLGRLVPAQGFLIGSVLLLRSEAITDVGAFDERFFLYAEETDWQRRATRRGWTVRLVEEAVAEHQGAGTGGDPYQRELRFHAAQELYIRKWHGTAGWQLYRAAAFSGAALRALSRGRSRRDLDRRRAAIYLRGPVRSLRRSGSLVSPEGGAASAPMRASGPRDVCTDAWSPASSGT